MLNELLFGQKCQKSRGVNTTLVRDQHKYLVVGMLGLSYLIIICKPYLDNGIDVIQRKLWFLDYVMVLKTKWTYIK